MPNKVSCMRSIWRRHLRPHHRKSCFAESQVCFLYWWLACSTVFGYYASSLCITVVLAAFLAILFDPVVVLLEKLHLPRSVAAATVVLSGMGLIGLLGCGLYGKTISFAEEIPVYTAKIRQTIGPISRNLQQFQQSAGSLTNDVQPAKKVARDPTAGIANLACLPGTRSGICVGSADYWRRGPTFSLLSCYCSKNQMVVRIGMPFSVRG